MIKKTVVCLAAAAFIFSAACTHRLKVDPIHITVDVNIKVDKALDDFFSDLDAPVVPAQTAPAAE